MFSIDVLISLMNGLVAVSLLSKFIASLWIHKQFTDVQRSLSASSDAHDSAMTTHQSHTPPTPKAGLGKPFKRCQCPERAKLGRASIRSPLHLVVLD